MQRSFFFLVGALAVLATSALSQEAPSNPAPSRILKFLNMEFSDPANWDCRRPEQNEGFPLSETDFTCLTCTNTGTGSSEVVVSLPPDGTQETVSLPDGSPLDVCADVLRIGSAAPGSPTPGESPTPGASPAPTATPGSEPSSGGQ